MKDAFRQKSTRDAILDATDRLLTRYGYKKMTIDDLAREVGIGKGSVYLHFTSKEEIALSHIDRIIDRLKKKLSAIAATDTPARDRLHQMLIERVVFRFDSVQHYTQNLNDLLSRIRMKLLERRRRYFREEAEIISRVVAEGQRQGEFIEGDPFEIADAFLVATNALLPYSLSTVELGNRQEVEQNARRIARLLLTGIMIRDKQS
jgi:AcrR family transcriptional regulator